MLGGRGWIARAAHLKKPRRGFFPRRIVRRVDAVRIHPCLPFVSAIKQKLRYPLDTGVLGGRGWIRTTEAESSRFTVCPHWPLGNTPIFIFSQPRRLPIYVTTESAVCQPIIWAARKKYIAITKALSSGCSLQRPGGRAFQPDKKSGEDHFWFFM